MKQQFYKQCEFKSGNTTVTAWVEDRNLEVGGQVSFKQDPEKWWDIVSVGTNKITKEQAKALERRNLAFQRKLG